MMEGETPMVSISCLAFNHEKFIRKALDGFIMQQTNFSFEVLIHDDASTDRTAKIIGSYADQYSEIIKPVYQTENQWIQGKRGSAVHNFPRAKGKYIALCEGDDYWTDPTKLQRQVDFLEAHAEYSMVAENAFVVNTENNTRYNFSDAGPSDIGLKQLLGKRRFPTASVLFRSDALDEEFYKLEYTGDVILWCYLAKKGKIRYLPNVSSVYLRGLQGVVLSSRNLEWARAMEKWNEVLAGILPPDFDRSILKQRNFNEYMRVFRRSVKKGQMKVSLQALQKCLQYQPVTTFKALAAIYAKKITG
jgi:glycosyltransferase involved in cell wall biosynthesis